MATGRRHAGRIQGAESLRCREPPPPIGLAATELKAQLVWPAAAAGHTNCPHALPAAQARRALAAADAFVVADGVGAEAGLVCEAAIHAWWRRAACGLDARGWPAGSAGGPGRPPCWPA